MRTVSLVLISLLFFSCSKENSNTELTDNHEQVVKQYFEHFNNHDWQKMADMYIDGAELKDPSIGNKVVTMTKKEFIAKYSELSEVFPNIKS